MARVAEVKTLRIRLVSCKEPSTLVVYSVPMIKQLNIRTCGSTNGQNTTNVPKNFKFSLLFYGSKGLVSKLVVHMKIAKYFTKQHAIKYGLKQWFWTC